MCQATRGKFALVLLAFGVASSSAVWAKESGATKPKAPALTSDLTLGEGVHFQNLTVFPVLSRRLRNEDAFITLDEGLASGKVTVAEVGALDHPAGNAAPQISEDDPFVQTAPAAPQVVLTPRQPAQRQQAPAAKVRRPNVLPKQSVLAPKRRTAQGRSVPTRQAAAAQHTNQRAGDARAQVNRLVIVNLSDKPLYMMPGEIIVGGKQDRTLAHETIIPPGKEPVAIDVFCVEHGRWAGRAGRDTVELARSISRSEISNQEAAALSEKAAGGQFVRSQGSLSKSGRQAVQLGKGQQEVWNQVTAQNKKSGAKTDSDAFTANYSEAGIVEKLQAYAAAVERPVAQQERVVGVIAAINGKPEMVDVFGSTPLFRKLWPKLLKSYALDASGAEPQPKGKACSLADAQAFLDSAAAAAVVETAGGGQGLAVTKRSNARVDSFSAQPSAESDAIGGGGFGGFGGGVHSSGFAK